MSKSDPVAGTLPAVGTEIAFVALSNLSQCYALIDKYGLDPTTWIHQPEGAGMVIWRGVVVRKYDEWAGPYRARVDVSCDNGLFLQYDFDRWESVTRPGHYPRIQVLSTPEDL